MNRKMIAMILTGIISVLLVTGCSSGNEDRGASNTDTIKEKSEAEQENTSVILPADAKIGIAYTEEDGEFISLFLNKMQGNLVSAGIPEENIEKRGGSDEELAENAAQLLSGGCSVLMVGNANADNAPGISDAAAKAGVPLLYFGASPGEKEIARWQEKGWSTVYVGYSFEQAAGKRAELIHSLGLEKADFDGDGEIGVVVLYTGENEDGDLINADALKALEQLEVPFRILTEDDEEEVYEGTDRDSSMEQVVSWMSDYGKELDLVLCADDSQALGALDALTDYKKKVGHDVLIMGFDADMESLAQAAAGKIRSTFFNDFMEQAQNASDTVMAFLKGMGTDKGASIRSEYVSVTVDNAQEILDIAGKVMESGSDSGESGEEEPEE